MKMGETPSGQVSELAEHICFVVETEALPDICARNLVTTDFLMDHSLCIPKGSRQRIALADGSQITTLGSVSLPCKFEND